MALEGYKGDSHTNVDSPWNGKIIYSAEFPILPFGSSSIVAIPRSVPQF